MGVIVTVLDTLTSLGLSLQRIALTTLAQKEQAVAHHLLYLAVIWLAFAGVVGTVAAAGGGQRLVAGVATGGVFLAVIASLLVFLA